MIRTSYTLRLTLYTLYLTLHTSRLMPYASRLALYALRPWAKQANQKALLKEVFSLKR